MKKIIAVGLLCGIMLTGCGVPDQAGDLLKEVEADKIFTEKEIADAAREAELQNTNEQWVISEEHQKQILLLRDYIMQKEKEGCFDLSEEEVPVLIDWAMAKSAGEKAFADNEISDSGWGIEFKSKENLLKFFEGLEKIGYTGLYEAMKNSVAKKEIDFSQKSRNISFDVWSSEEKDVYAEASILASKYFVRYPASFREVIEDKIAGGFGVDSLTTGGYLQRMCISSSASLSLEGNPYSKECALYMKDGKLLQIEVIICYPNWVSRQDKDGKSKKTEIFFTQKEAEDMKNLLGMLGVNETDAVEFCKTFGTDSGRSGNIGSVKWYLTDQKRTKYEEDGEERYWRFRIQ